VTVSEGIGVGLILNGQLVRGSSGLAGEFGHIALNENGPKCRCGNQGCWEVYASNSAALRHYNEVMLPARGGKAESGASRSLAEFDDLLSVAEHGDKEAVATLERMGHYLGRGIAMLVTGLAPEVIVVVGEVTQAWDRVLPIITEVVKQHCLTHSTTRIIASDPARLPRLRGIVALVLQKHFGAPAIA
jgi:predicted NBD/HSP70 family sugar kinase